MKQGDKVPVKEIIPERENSQKSIDSKTPEVEIIPQRENGQSRDQLASLFGTNGKRRTNEDKRRAVMRLLEDDEWKEWSSNKIAKACMVDNKTVDKYRSELSLRNSQVSERKYVTKHGTVATMKTANIGKVEEIKKPPI